MFQWAPTLGGECYHTPQYTLTVQLAKFQWAPTLGGECYRADYYALCRSAIRFQWAPTLGGECYVRRTRVLDELHRLVSMGTHPWG